MEPRNRAELVYRSHTFAVIGWSMLLLVGLVVATILMAGPDPRVFWVPVTVLLGGAAAWLLYRCYVAPRVVATDWGVRVVNPFSTTEMRWWEIERFDSRPMLTVVRRDGTTVTAWAVQHALTAKLVGRMSQGESVATALTRQLAAAKLPPPAPPGYGQSTA
ncbi:MAG TPA: PH domain-containing protein [Acidimicrobiales bacterium]|nr:PH domain-containing protein [Acidimicrobiales bacterium]